MCTTVTVSAVDRCLQGKDPKLLYILSSRIGQTWTKEKQLYCCQNKEQD